MKGVVFRQFLEFAEQEFGEAQIDALLRTADLQSAGIYTNVGYYDHVELLALVTALSNQTGRSARELLVSFGRSLFPSLISDHPQSGVDHAFDLIERIHGVIHRDVRKLYPAAEVPDIQPRSRDGNREIRITYASRRPMADLCEGMIMAALDHYHNLDDFEIVRTDSKHRYLYNADFHVYRRD
jgi:Haem-NO-binding